MHFNDFFLEPLKKISFKLKLAKEKRWYFGNDISLTPDADPFEIFRGKILSASPVMIARFGSTELTCVLAYILSRANRSYFKKAIEYIHGEIPAFWFGHKNRTEICANSGFFPNDKKLIIRFSERMLSDAKEMDVLLTWLNGEKYTFPFLSPSCKIISLWAIEPFFQDKPWTMCLAGMKVLVIHPYSKTIEKQYRNRHNIFPTKQVLPEMDLKTFKAVQTIENNKAPYDNWFHALSDMEQQIEQIDFDIALIGAGAYGLSLAAHIKRMGKKAIHVGGSLQLYFGILGLRWENMPHFKEIFNEHWVRPLPEEHPADYKKMEGGAYW